MKWLKTYKLYLEQDENELDSDNSTDTVDEEAKKQNENALEYLRKEIMDFKQKKTTMEREFKKAENDTKFDLEKALDTIYGNIRYPEKPNRFLKRYETQLKLKLDLIRIKQKVEENKKKIIKKQDLLNDNKTNQKSLRDSGPNNKLFKTLKDTQKELESGIKKLREDIKIEEIKLNKIKENDLKKAIKSFEEFLNQESIRLKEMQNATK